MVGCKGRTNHAHDTCRTGDMFRVMLSVPRVLSRSEMMREDGVEREMEGERVTEGKWEEEKEKERERKEINELERKRER